MMRTLVLLLVTVEVLFPLLLCLGCNSLVFFPAGKPSPEEGLARFGSTHAELVHVRRADGRELAAYDVQPARAASDGPVVLFLHGNAGNIATRAETAAWFAETTGCRLLLLDYSGYGGNDGSPSEETLREDALAAFEHLVTAGVAAERIVLYGESIGTWAALCVATERPVAGVVLQSGPSSLSSMAREMYPWMPLAALLVSGKFPSVEKIAAVKAPVVVVHGRADRMIPFSEAQRLHAAAPAGTELLAIDGADHNDLFDVGGDAYLRGLAERFRKWVPRHE